MARGGYRKPEGGPRAPGVGKNSQRTDTQPINVPNVQDSEDLTHGDRQRLEAGMRVQGVGRQRTPQMQAPTGRSRIPSPGQAGPPPDYLMSSPSTRPLEPETTGLDVGPGPGREVLQNPTPPDDIRILALERYARIYDNPDAKQMLNTVFKRQAQPAPVPAPMTAPGTAPEIEPSIDLDVPAEEMPI